MDKRGVLGLSTVQAVIVAFLVIGVLIIAVLMALSSMNNAYEGSETLTSATITNESIGTVSSLAYVDFPSKTNYRNAKCVLVECMNNTVLYIPIPGENSTNSSCSVTYSGVKDTGGLNGTGWKCSYTVTYNTNSSYALIENVGRGMKNWSTYIPTIMILLAVVVIVLVIAIVIVAVSRFRTGGEVSIGSGSGGSATGLDNI